jgi:hypothetical protein
MAMGMDDNTRTDDTGGGALGWQRIEAPIQARIEEVVPAPNGARLQLIGMMQDQGFTHRIRGSLELHEVSTRWLGSAWGEGERYGNRYDGKS